MDAGRDSAVEAPFRSTTIRELGLSTKRSVQAGSRCVRMTLPYGGSDAGLYEMRCGEPGVTRERFKASHSVDASDRFVCTHRSTGYRTECHFAVGLLQLA